MKDELDHGQLVLCLRSFRHTLPIMVLLKEKLSRHGRMSLTTTGYQAEKASGMNTKRARKDQSTARIELGFRVRQMRLARQSMRTPCGTFALASRS